MISIDLGTTNSAIRMQNGAPVIIKSDKQKIQCHPASILQEKDILVGDPAVDALQNDNVRALRTFEKSNQTHLLSLKNYGNYK